MDNLLGQFTLEYYRDAFIFGVIGFSLFKWFTFTKNKKTGVFSMNIWIQENWFDVLNAFMFFFIWIRFKNDIISVFGENPLVIFLQSATDSFFLHFVFGLLSTSISNQLRKYLRKSK